MVQQYEHRQATQQAADLAFKVLTHNKICLIYTGTGGGKTYMSIHTIGNVDPQANIIVFTSAKHVASGEWDASVASYNEVQKTNLKIKATTYASITYDEKYQALIDTLKTNQGNSYFILDEVQNIKNPTSISAKRIITIMKHNLVNRMVALSATPIAESYLDALTLLILGGFYRNKSQFYREQNLRLDEYHQPIVRNRYGKIDRNLFGDPDLIDKQLASITVSIDTSKLLPPSRSITYTFELTDAERKEYNQIIRDYRNGAYESIHQAIAAQRTFLAEHCTQRNEALYQLITHPKRKKTPVLIFYMYVAELNALKEFIKKHLPEYDVIEVNGKSRKVKASQKPKKDDTLYLIQYRAGSEANNMPFAHLTIFYAPTNSGNQFIQSCGRNIRAYHNDLITQIRFVVLNTLNAHLWYDIIDNKVSFNKEMQQIFLKNQLAKVDIVCT